ncbi:MurR/RpiR family transcriptional regulator [Wansuia hejianensis]|uniref:MurR/RpiR family transcriptional regulator n=1 Tax=Wansuia hejianensis TaxID=2763667 RepID=A0A926EUM7_9FIRM|nr:MurR/RpiR family transcriptional regulator [Wansuia hejianensis]MBC8590133.1 MurR/RpiR family transcriptional regulator [Wansuia hejianensis]
MNLSKLTERYDELTDLEKKIVEYIINNPKSIQDLPASEIANILYVSKTSIINLSKKLGFEGYSELRYYVKNYLKGQEKDKKDLTYEGILENINIEVSKTISLQNEDNINKIIDKILSSRVVYIVARGASGPIGSLLSSRLAMMNIRAILIGDPNIIDVLGDSLSPDETIIVLSLSGETERILTIAKTARARGIDVIALTSFTNNSLQRIANYNMFCFADDIETKYNDLISRIGLHTLVQILISYIAMKDKNKE